MDGMAGLTSGLLEIAQVAAGLPNMIFFHEINSFLNDEIAEFASNLLGRTVAFLGGLVFTVLTLWILIQGYRIATGQSRGSMMVLVTNSLRAVLIIGIATGAAAGAASIYSTLTDGLTEGVNAMVTGDKDGGAYDDIDKTLAIMQVALEVIDSIDTGDDLVTADRKDRALWFTGIGLGGPAIMAGGMLLLNKIAIAIIVGLGPLFILCLLFNQTKPLFNKWLLYGIGTLFSMAVLSVIVTLALDMVIAVGMAFWLGSWLTGGSQESMTAMAMQQGGLGIILTMLIITVPPMAAVLFQGTLGSFAAFNSLNALSPGGGQAPPPGSGLPPGQPYSGYIPPPRNMADNVSQGNPTSQPVSGFISAGSYAGSYTTHPDSIKKGSDTSRGI